MLAWVRCPCCENFWCTIHQRHAFECDCPPIEEWTSNPYGERTMPMTRQKNMRLDDLTLLRLEHLAAKWSQAEPLTASAVIRECVRRVHETETKTKTKTKEKQR